MITTSFSPPDTAITRIGACAEVRRGVRLAAIAGPWLPAGVALAAGGMTADCVLWVPATRGNAVRATPAQCIETTFS